MDIMQLSLCGNPQQMFLASIGNAIAKQIEAIHNPDCVSVSMKPILDIVEDIFRRAIPAIQGIIQGAHMQADALDERASYSSLNDELKQHLSGTINRISCEIAHRVSVGEDAHSTTLAIAHMVQNYSWDAKVVLALAAFAMTYGEFLLLLQLSTTTNPLAKGVGLLKQFPEVLDRTNILEPKFDTLADLINAILHAAKIIVQFKELPSQYISSEDPEMVSAYADIPSAVYWIIRSTVVCASQVIGLTGMGHESLSSATDAGELSNLVHNIYSIHSDLMEKLQRCRQRLSKRNDNEAYQTLLRLFDAIHPDNMKILKALIRAKEDQLPLWDGTTQKRVSIEVLRRKTVLLLISDLGMPRDELLVLEQWYNESREHGDQYEVVWIPVLDRSTPFDDTKMKRFESLQAMMPWYSVGHPSMIDPAVVRYIKEVWGFNKKPLLVVLDPRGQVVNTNAIHMVFIWGSSAYPFTKSREDALWGEETWRIELSAESLDPNLFKPSEEGKHLCLYGGEDIEWIRKFTAKAKEVAQAANINLEMVYMGKSNPKERVQRNIATIQRENLSHVLPDISCIWFFWVRLQSMWQSRILQPGVTVENDEILQGITTILSFDGSNKGWALICQGSDGMAQAEAETMLESLEHFKAWEAKAVEKGFIPALNDYIGSLRTEHHSHHLVLPEIDPSASNMIVCLECGEPMEKLVMYRCCK